MSRNYKIHDPRGVYFLTFATVGWIDVFTRPVYKELLIDSIKHCQQHKGLLVHAWCIMSNHVHIIASTQGNSISDILRDLKKFTSKRIIEEITQNPQESRKEWMLAIFRNSGRYNRNNEIFQFWQQHNHPIQSDTGDIMKQKLNYIHENPVKAGFVTDAAYYPHSSAYDYAGGKGLLEIDFLF